MKKYLVLIALLSACGGGETKKELVCVIGPTPTSGVYLLPVNFDEQSLTLEVVGNGITDLYGLAFRLQYDPEVLDFTEMIPAADWPAEAISISHETQTGILVAAVTSRGSATGLNFQDQVMATLHFDLLKEGESGIRFINHSCALVSTSGTQIPDLAWSGGSLELR